MFMILTIVLLWSFVICFFVAAPLFNKQTLLFIASNKKTVKKDHEVEELLLKKEFLTGQLKHALIHKKQNEPSFNATLEELCDVYSSLNKNPTPKNPHSQLP